MKKREKKPKIYHPLNKNDVGRLSERELMPAQSEKLCPNCGCKNDLDARWCCECPWSFELSAYVSE